MDAILGTIKSKTMWAGVALVILGTLAEPVNAWISSNPGLASTLIGAVFMALRAFTTQSLAAKGNPPGQGMSA